VAIHFAALDDPAAGAEGSNSLTLTVASGEYVVGSPASATVTIPANGLVVVNTNDRWGRQPAPGHSQRQCLGQ
jgi:hypothetical protein